MGGERQAPSGTIIVRVGDTTCLHTRGRVCTPMPHVTLHGPHSPGSHLQAGRKHQFLAGGGRARGGRILYAKKILRNREKAFDVRI